VVVSPMFENNPEPLKISSIYAACVVFIGLNIAVVEAVAMPGKESV
jgi:hypothetical protein